MQFVQLRLSHKRAMSLISGLPEKWWKHPFNDISRLLGLLHSDAGRLSEIASDISMDIGQLWIRRRMRGREGIPLLVNCMVSEERVVTFNIPMALPDLTEFHQIKVTPVDGGDFQIDIFYPSAEKGVAWYGQMAAGLVYGPGGDAGGDVCVDGETISVRAWNVICAMLMAEGGAMGHAGILWDMARDKEI